MTVVLTEAEVETLKVCIAELLLHEEWRQVGEEEVLAMRILRRNDGRYLVSYR